MKIKSLFIRFLCAIGLHAYKHGEYDDNKGNSGGAMICKHCGHVDYSDWDIL